jgi:hypothetical protein
MPTEKRKLNRMVVGYKVDHDNHRKLQEMLNNANMVSEGMVQTLATTAVDKESVADTGATVVFRETGLMQEMGLKLEQLLPTNLTLFTVDKKSLTVLGAVPVIISVQCEDGGTATTRDLLYIMEELSSVFISRDALSNLGIIGKEFPKVHSSMSLSWVAGVQGSSADTAIEQNSIKPDHFIGETADCGCSVRELPPEPPTMPFPATEENKEKLKQFLVEGYRASTSVLDSWNGYHSVTIREEDRHLTTFYTKWGRYRYKCAPQGYQQVQHNHHGCQGCQEGDQ